MRSARNYIDATNRVRIIGASEERRCDRNSILGDDAELAGDASNHESG
jgi:hypothetical protein